MSIIESDMIAFDCINRSGFINNIFERFASLADATISIRVQKRQEELEDILKGLNDDDRKRVINLLIKNYEQQLIKKVNGYEKGVYFKFRIRQSNLEVLTDPADDFYQKKYYNDKIGAYFKALLEEYASLSYIERERIYFANHIKTIEEALKNNYRLRISTNNNYSGYVLPYKIMSAKMDLYNYLVGYSFLNNEDIVNKKACSFRISNIKSLRIIKSRKSNLNKRDKQELERLIEKRGVQFLLDDSHKIIVQLSPQGIELYNNNLQLRPKFIEKEGNLYTFDCTLRQIEYYFFKFGNKVKIIQPQSLAETFKEMYADAISAYD